MLESVVPIVNEAIRRRLGEPVEDSIYLHAPVAAALEASWDLRIRFTPTRPVESFAHLARKKQDVLRVCPLCSHSRVKSIGDPGGQHGKPSTPWEYHVVRCNRCGLLYRMPGLRPWRLNRALAKRRPRKALKGEAAAQRELRWSQTLESFGVGISEGLGDRLLDYGCGAGEFLDLALARGWEAHGYDRSTKAVAAAAERLGADRVHTGDPLQVAAAAGGTFDVITMWSLLGDIPDPRRELADIRSLLSPGGVLLIMTPNAGSLHHRAHRSSWNGYTRDSLTFWDHVTLPELFARTGFAGYKFAPFYQESIELGKSPLSAVQRERYRRTVDRYRCGELIRVAAINGPLNLSKVGRFVAIS